MARTKLESPLILVCRLLQNEFMLARSNMKQSQQVPIYIYIIDEGKTICVPRMWAKYSEQQADSTSPNCGFLTHLLVRISKRNCTYGWELLVLTLDY